MAKEKRKFIRIKGQLLGSPRHLSKRKDSSRLINDWYLEKLKEKDWLEHGVRQISEVTFLDYSAQWIRNLAKTHPRSTVSDYEQNLRKHLLPHLGDVPMHRITRALMREVLLKIQVDGGLSIRTRTKIQATASTIFTSAMNENPPLREDNPCSRIAFADARQGTKMPATLEDDAEVLAYLKTAKKLGPNQFTAVCLAVMSGLRKSEIIPLRWRNVKWKLFRLVIDSHCEQASLSILPGTKGGQDEARDVPVADELLTVLKSHRARSKFKDDEHFIISDESGDWIRPRVFHAMIDEIVQKYGRPITLHKLRHTYGRMSAVKHGNMRALQEILGHKSPTTTALYSKLAGKQLEPFGRQMSYGLGKTRKSSKD